VLEACRAVPRTSSIDSAGGAFSAGKLASVGANIMQGWESREPETKIDKYHRTTGSAEIGLFKLTATDPE
jgi:hypothetical protein